MQNRLSVRSYTLQSKTHSHNYHQLVFPVQGSIDIEISRDNDISYSGVVSVGDCVVIKAGWDHRFSAHEAARFVVADLTSLPEFIGKTAEVNFSLTEPFKAFMHYIDSQLSSQTSAAIEENYLNLFDSLLQQQLTAKQKDSRIEKVIQQIQHDIAQPHSIESLAKTACLSPTQFKKLFSQNTGLSCQKYITQQRMEKAKALLIYTDTPLQIIAEQVGYSDFSAFSRRFSAYFGQSPKSFRKSSA